MEDLTVFKTEIRENGHQRVSIQNTGNDLRTIGRQIFLPLSEFPFTLKKLLCISRESYRIGRCSIHCKKQILFHEFDSLCNEKRNLFLCIRLGNTNSNPGIIVWVAISYKVSFC